MTFGLYHSGIAPWRTNHMMTGLRQLENGPLGMLCSCASLHRFGSGLNHTACIQYYSTRNHLDNIPLRMVCIISYLASPSSARSHRPCIFSHLDCSARLGSLRIDNVPPRTKHSKNLSKTMGYTSVQTWDSVRHHNYQVGPYGSLSSNLLCTSLLSKLRAQHKACAEVSM